MDPAMLRVIFGHRIEKLTLPSGIPETMEELNLTVKQTLSIPNDFSLQYLDPDFEDFFTLNSTAEITHKATIKVVTIEPVVLNLYPVPHTESFDESFSSEQSHEPASTSSTAQDSYDSCESSPASSAVMSASSSLQKKPWPTEFMNE